MAKKTYPVSSFDICLSNRCNLMCRYCYFDSINRGEPQFLTFDQIKRAVDMYVDLVSVRGIDKVSLAGGEPFLDFALLERAVAYVRRACGPKVDIEVFTNGTLATPERLRRLFRHNAKVVLSLDGRKASNDLHRVFASGKGSVYDKVMANFSGLTAEERTRICASMTVTAATGGALAENVRFLREAGFGEVQINLNLLEQWPAARLAALARSVKKLKTYYSDLYRTTARSFSDFRFGLEYILLKWDETLEESGVFKEISIAPDGRFYPCGLVSTYGPQKLPFAIGDLKRGFDVKRISSLRAESVRAIKAADRGIGMLEYLPNPMLLYFEAILKGEDRRRVFANVRRLFKIFYDEMSPLLRLERMFDILSSDPRFGDFAHEPPLRAAAAARRLRVAPERKPGDRAYVCPCGKGRVGFPGLSAQRAALDLLLYSPGGEKTLALTPESPAEDFELAGLLAVYGGMKAAALGKKFESRFAYAPGALGREEEEFLAFAGVKRAALVDAATAGRAKGFDGAALSFDPRRPAAALKALRLLKTAGVESVNLEPKGVLDPETAGLLLDAMLDGKTPLLENAERLLRPGGASLVTRRDGKPAALPFSYTGPARGGRPAKAGGGAWTLPEPPPDPVAAALGPALLARLKQPARAAAFRRIFNRGRA